MSQEKRSGLNFSVTVGGMTVQQVMQLTEDLAGYQAAGLRQSLAAGTWTALNLGTVTVADLLCVVNDDATHYVELATANDNTGIFARLKPGRFCFIPANPSASYYGRANTAACIVKNIAVEA